MELCALALAGVRCLLGIQPGEVGAGDKDLAVTMTVVCLKPGREISSKCVPVNRRASCQAMGHPNTPARRRWAGMGDPGDSVGAAGNRETPVGAHEAYLDGYRDE